jgi:UDP-N-acetylglucosamine--N-acetylmuramyl-(pentapeptide) pyrophosphoryl-undecaprenol N-acetylglucosamine transferase
MKKVVLTGGHLTPALGVIEQILKEKDNWEIFYFGRKYALESNKAESFEYRTLSKRAKINFVPITTGRVQRKFTPNTIKSLIKIPFGFLQALWLLIKIKPKAIISFGGYLSVPVVISGWLLGIPAITHEQTRTVGLGTKINKFFVKKIAVSFPEVINQLPAKKTVLTGNPVESAVFKYRPNKNDVHFKPIIKSKKPLIVVTGGKTGSQIINQTVLKIKDKLTKNYFIFHQIGLDSNVEEKIEHNYIAVRFKENHEFGWLYRQSDLVIGRSGANICTYLAALKKPALLIPIPWTAENEQVKNAQWLEEIGLAKKIDQKSLSPKLLYKEIKSMIKLDKNVKLPQWWNRSDPRSAGEKVWRLAKGLL